AQVKIREKAAALAEQEVKINQELKNVNDSLLAAASEQTEIEKAILATEQKINMLRAMDEELQGYGPGTRAALRASEEGRLTGIHGAVG
ncbi:MAG TPA: hypothetical protein DG577_05555, partial [Firmicutes bacterium]|nr:hypothetical protein [Bacillota bacterium]